MHTHHNFSLGILEGNPEIHGIVQQSPVNKKKNEKTPERKPRQALQALTVNKNFHVMFIPTTM